MLSIWEFLTFSDKEIVSKIKIQTQSLKNDQKLHLLSPKIVWFEFTLNLSRTKLFFPHFVYHSLEICLPLGFYVNSDFGIAEVSKIANLTVFFLKAEICQDKIQSLWKC